VRHKRRRLQRQRKKALKAFLRLKKTVDAWNRKVEAS
jgi:hypothetical protein